MLAFSRTRNSSQALADMARAAGLRAETPDDAEAVVRAARILVNSVPLAPGVTPFLGPRWLAPGSFVRAIDLARSWYPEHLRKIDVLATDDHDQQAALPPLSPALGPRGTFDADLAELVSGCAPPAPAGALTKFVFRGAALANLAVGTLAWRRAGERGIRRRLPR